MKMFGICRQFKHICSFPVYAYITLKCQLPGDWTPANISIIEKKISGKLYINHCDTNICKDPGTDLKYKPLFGEMHEWNREVDHLSKNPNGLYDDQGHHGTAKQYRKTSVCCQTVMS